MKKSVLILCICAILLFQPNSIAEQPNKALEAINHFLNIGKGNNNADTPDKADDSDNPDSDGNSFDDSDLSFISDFFDRQNTYSSSLQSTVIMRIKEYWEVELLDFSLYLNDAFIYGESDIETISTINVYLKWDVNNSVEQTKDMLEMYSDDLAVTIHKAKPDVPIESLCVFWTVPNITKAGNAAKFMYYSAGEDMYNKGKSGPLYSK